MTMSLRLQYRIPELTEEIIQRYKCETISHYEAIEDDLEQDFEPLPTNRSGAIVPLMCH